MSRRKQRIFAVLLGLAALAVAAFGIYLAAAFRDTEPVLLSETPPPEDTAAAFLDALCRGDYTAAAAFLDGQPDLGLISLPETEPERQLTLAFRSSWSWQAGQIWQNNAEARLPIAFTALNLTLLARDLEQEVQAILAQRLENAQRQEELYNEDNSWRQEAVMDALNTAITRRLQSAGDYTATTRLTLQLRYEDRRWVVVPDEMLYSVLSGEVAP